MSLSDDAQKLIARFSLGFVATIAEDGSPRVSPKGTFLALDAQTLGFGAIRSPGTLSNLRARPEVEVNFADPFARKAVRARGKARIAARGTDDYAKLIPNWHATWGSLADRITALVLIDVSVAEMILTPPYDDGVTEAELIAAYQAKYAEIYP